MKPLYSLDAEASVLGGLFEHVEIFSDIQAVVKPEHFYSGEYRKIYQSMLNIKKANRTIDVVNVKKELSAEDGFEDIDEVIAFLPEPSIDQCMEHAEIVRDYGEKRSVQGAAIELQDYISQNPNAPRAELISFVNKKINNPIEEGGGTGTATIINYEDLVPITLKQIQERAESGSELTGLPTGLRELDKLTSGLQRTDLIVIAGRPSMGKTTVSCNIIDNICMAGYRAMIFSLEMPKEQIMQRTLASVGRIDQTRLRNGTMNAAEVARLTPAATRAKTFDCVIDDDGDLDIHTLRARAMKEHRKKPLDIIMIDYLQLMKLKDSNNKTNEIGEISRALKFLAKDLNVPIIVLSQLNRSLESRQDKRPINSDLRDSGAIEQDADIIMFVYRDEVYNPDTEDKGIGEIIIGKHRNGPLGTARTRFVGNESRFENLPRGEEGQPAPAPAPHLSVVDNEKAEMVTDFDVNSVDSPI